MLGRFIIPRMRGLLRVPARCKCQTSSPYAILAVWKIYGHHGAWPLLRRKYHSHKNAFFALSHPRIAMQNIIFSIVVNAAL